MTYEKQNDAIVVAEGIGFNECVFTRAQTAVLVRVASGTAVSPTQRFGKVALVATATGSAQRVQSTVIEFDAAGALEPVVRFTGVCHHPYVENAATGKSFLVRVEVGVGEELVIDMGARTVKLDGQMVWGYSGRWLNVKPGDTIRAGAGGIAGGFSAEMDVVTVGGLITKRVSGTAGADHRALGRPQIDVARVGGASAEATGRGGRQGVGAGKLGATGGGTAEKRRGY